MGDTPRPQRQGPAWSEDPHVRVQATERNGLDYRLSLEADQPGEVVVGIYAYPGWKVEGDASLGTGPEGFLRVAVAHPGHYQVRVYFGSTPLRTTATLISLLALLGLLPALGRLQAALG